LWPNVSSSDAILFMLSTSLSQDLYRRFVRPSATDSDILRVVRCTVVCGGALGTSLAIVSESIAAALSFFYTLLTVSLFVPVIAGACSRRLSAPEAVASIASGVTLAAIIQIASAGRGPAGLTPTMFGLGGAALGWAVVSVLKTRSAP
jgi:SSS family solute:Na+ symporter